MASSSPPPLTPPSPPPTALHFNDLPAELIHQIILNLDPPSFRALKNTSTHLRALADTPILWRHFCRTQFKYWDPRHDFSRQLSRPVEEVDWASWYASRRILERQVDRLVNGMVANARGRIEKMEMIVNIDTAILQGNRNLWDVKDALLKHVNCPDDADDVLARRFWAQATIDRLHRARAVGIWAGVKDGTENWPLERVLAAYDMFATGGLEDADCADVSEALDDLAKSFTRDHPTHDEWTTRERARTLAHYLRSLGFRGTQDVFYHNLPNNFIVHALQDPDHPALPIICVSIYCGVARRLGIQASPCGFPMHVYAVIEATNAISLDGGALPSLSLDPTPQRMYIDAFRPEVEVPLSHLTAQLATMGGAASHQTYLGPASDNEIILRTSRNIMHSVRVAQNRPSRDGIFTDTEGWPDMDVSLYAALWVSVLFRDDADTDWAEQRRRMRHQLPFLCELFQNYFPWDVALFEELVLPLLAGLPEFGNMVQILRVVRAGDEMAKPVVKRGPHTRGVVEHKVGRVFRHRRFRYMAVVVGWDVKCDASEEWVAQMGIDRLERGREQSFYHVL
jgi:F-box protein 21